MGSIMMEQVGICDLMLQPNSDSRWTGKRLSMLSYLDAASGYCNHAAQLFRHWERMGVFVSVRPLFIKEYEDAKVPMILKRSEVRREQPEQWQFVLSPASYRPMQRRKDCVWTMFESSRWTPRQIKLLNRAEAIIVPCEWNRQGLRESGCIRPVHVVPLGFNDEVFNPTPMQMDGPTIFGCAGRQSHGAIRKGLNVVIESFLKEFPTEQDVRLHVKGFKDCPTRYVFDKRVVVRDGFLKEAQLADWYAGLTCFVSAARGEAWGLMQLEAMASGRPVCASIYAGLDEFMTPDNSYAIDFKEGQSEEAWSISGGQWAIPDENHIRKLMRSIYLDRETARKIGLKAASDVAKFTWKNSAVKCLQVLESLGAL